MNGASAQQEWEFARSLWADAFVNFAVDLGRANVPFTSRWQVRASDKRHPLTHVAHVMWAISNSHTEKGKQLLAQKVRELVYSGDEDDFIARVGELEAAAILSSRVSPIVFEPAVLPDTDPSNVPPSADYSVSPPGGEVFIEVTTTDVRAELDQESLFRRMHNILRKKRTQAFRDRAYVLAIKIIGTSTTFVRMKDVIANRLWSEARSRRCAGIFCFTDDENGPSGRFRAAWLSNPNTSVPASSEFVAMISGQRAYHLMRMDALNCGDDEIARLRERSRPPWEPVGLSIPARLVKGPLDGLEVALKPTEVGSSQVTYTWDDFNGAARFENMSVSIPPHGPIKVVYKRVRDTLYEFDAYGLWMNEIRPSGTARREFLLEVQWE
jgi:hypothetical protein